MVHIATAGTTVQRWGRSVNRADRTPINAQPSPKPTSIDPVMTASPAPAKTPRVSARAMTSPAATDTATIRANGP